MTRTCSNCGAEYADGDKTTRCTNMYRMGPPDEKPFPMAWARMLPCAGLIFPEPAQPPRCLLCMDAGAVRLYDGTNIKCPRGHAGEGAC